MAAGKHPDQAWVQVFGVSPPDGVSSHSFSTLLQHIQTKNTSEREWRCYEVIVLSPPPTQATRQQVSADNTNKAPKKKTDGPYEVTALLPGRRWYFLAIDELRCITDTCVNTCMLKRVGGHNFLCGRLRESLWADGERLLIAVMMRFISSVMFQSQQRDTRNREISWMFVCCTAVCVCVFVRLYIFFLFSFFSSGLIGLYWRSNHVAWHKCTLHGTN